MVVDSCLDSPGGEPVARRYLGEIGVDIANQVKVVVATHWHDDHIQGISSLLREASSARFACSAALMQAEFLELVASSNKIKLVEHTSGAAEFADVLDILGSRSSTNYRKGPDFWAQDGQLLYRDNNASGVEVHALSPSSQTVTNSLGRIARLIPQVGRTIRRFPSFAPNDLSVVLLVKSPGTHFLLGGDLEVSGDNLRGWQAVITSQQRPNVLSSAYKVAHHGSDGADLEAIWSSLLLPNPYAFLTPYAKGSRPRPDPDDVQRIKNRTNRVYCTVWPPTAQPPGRSVDRIVNAIARRRRAVSQRPGHIRLRVPLNGSPNDIRVELFDNSRRLP